MVALGGVMAALAVVCMSLGTLIPLATYVCPMLCMLLLRVVRTMCGDRIGWAWYGAVAILSLLMAPDKEAAAVFAALGYYPILKPKMDQLRGRWIWKLLFFNSVILILYWLLLNLFGLEQVVRDFAEAGVFFTVLLLAMGNITFVLLDRLLGMQPRRRK